ncbi:hypothetical protein [Bacillus sp. FJAT-29814]|uniref:hypothetical protein n=1 Tax=Bacillus sp. FJAT-29814 TaxID=1729688 RepID=UPI00082C609D|nr:hypothetical protein [Bacillus sp. FJAT-29814]
MKKKLGSRKFLVTVAGVITVIANDYFDLGLDGESVLALVSVIAAYVLGQAHVDAKTKGVE